MAPRLFNKFIIILESKRQYGEDHHLYPHTKILPEIQFETH